ncbi:MAG TPA: hypothetical protein VL326_32365, partial [Kofleriaceae bacterium]|nr:hypothetical protein [Kofleriaceae bacterium]
KEIDRALRSLAQQQAALDADEAHWLRIADQQKVWPELGYVHALEYLEDVFGYAPRTALERMRVARELGALPQLEDALRVGELSYSAVRELSRVATPETVEGWIEQARGRRFRDIEQMVSGRKKGDNPEEVPDPALVKHRVVLELQLKDLLHLAPDCDALAVELEDEPVLHPRWICWRIWVVALLAPRDHLLHIAQATAARLCHPTLEGFGCRDAGQLAHDGMAQLATPQRILELRQRTKLARDTKALLCCLRGVAEDFF